ncbi:P-loop containing nucleoside triphosphate hydrolase protein [Rhizophagus clarus]|uniref:P-loop containing nucleoside triphosphate hydrolase protein n=1 Tax=Rhizophagus clarus TaxID=94130 RepID=A0A8H3QJ17_9GLOM|nr:P-loop containing nucleoside triphosphate hydrolase protein [Rhizophagus clarus]
MIYSERYLSDMERSLNCLILGETTFDNIFTLDICTKNIIDNKMINKSQLKVSHLKALIWNKKTHVDIEDKLGGKILRPGKFYSTYFPDDEKPTENVRIIVVLPLI